MNIKLKILVIESRITLTVVVNTRSQQLQVKDSILCMITASMYDGSIYFNCYPDLTLALDEPNIVKTLTLNIASSGYHVEEGSKPFALIYRIYYRLMGTQMNPCATTTLFTLFTTSLVILQTL